MPVTHTVCRGLGRMALAVLMGLASIVVLMMAGTTPAQAKDAPEKWGKRLVQTIDLPPDVLAKFALFQEKKAKGAASGGAMPPGGLYADTQSWVGSDIDLPASGNPYTVVVRVAGVVQADGDAGTRWLAGWSMDGASRVNVIPEIVAKSGKAGQAVEVAGASPPVSFKENRKLQPAVEFATVRNLRMDRVQVEVWSGMRQSTFMELFTSWIPLFSGVVFLGLFLWWRRT